MKIIIALFLLSLVYVHAALTPEQMGKLQHILEDCKQKVDVSDQDVSLMMQHQLPETQNGKCFAACVKKQLGIMNDDNTVNVEHVQELVTKHIKDTDKHDTIMKIVETCSAEVPGGSDECDVSMKLMECCIRESKAAELELNFIELISS